MVGRFGVIALACVGCWTTPASPTPRQTPLLIASSPPSNHGKARRVRIDMQDEAELVSAGFSHYVGGTTRFENGKAIVETTGYEEWGQEQGTPGGFVEKAANGPWAVEARFSLDVGCFKAATGLWIHDGRHFAHVTVSDHTLAYAGNQLDIGPTNVMRTYRVEYRDGKTSIFVDRKLVFAGAADETMASVTLMFGNLGDSCPQNRSTWDYLAYETAP